MGVPGVFVVIHGLCVVVVVVVVLSRSTTGHEDRCTGDEGRLLLCRVMIRTTLVLKLAMAIDDNVPALSRSRYNSSSRGRWKMCGRLRDAHGRRRWPRKERHGGIGRWDSACKGHLGISAFPYLGISASP